MPNTTMQDLLDKYIKSRITKNSAVSYAEFLRRRGNDYEGEYIDALTDASVKRRREYGDYGKRAESLSGEGLTKSGYADFLRLKSDEEHSDAIDELRAERDSKASRAHGSYLSYLAKYTKDQDSIRERVRRQLVKDEVLDINAAYNFGIQAGLSHEEATSVSHAVIGSTRVKVRNRIITYIYESKMSAEQAADYAREIGLPDEDVKKILAIGQKHESDSHGISDSYRDYLESLGNQNTGSYGKPSGEKPKN